MTPPHQRITIKTYFKNKKVTAIDFENTPEIRLAMPNPTEVHDYYLKLFNEAGNNNLVYEIIVSEDGINHTTL